MKIEDLIKRSDAAEVVYKALKTPPLKGVLTDTMSLAIALVRDIPSADDEVISKLKTAIENEEICKNCPTAERITGENLLGAMALGFSYGIETDRPQEWIPCNERLPSENDEYIITMGKDSFNKEGYVTWAMFDKLKKKFYFPGGRVNYYIAVTAWMPRPKPWKGADDE